VIMALSQNVPMMIAGRGLIGFAAAIGANPAIVYLTEIARKDMRGSLISFGPALSSLGTAAFSQRVVPISWSFQEWYSLSSWVGS
jgi:facilitated trehalose transporter